MSPSIALPLALLVTACSSQPLTKDMTGTGGATGGSSNTGTGGAVAATVAACTDLANQYQQALAAAQSCDVGAAGGCQQSVPSALSVCTACLTYVSDTSKLDVVRLLWDTDNCPAVLPKVPCSHSVCLAPTNNACVPADGGARGVCATVVGGTGGGATDAGASACDALVDKYAAALASATSCTVGAAGQCAHAVSPSVLPCRSTCVQYVNDTTELDAIRQAWEQQGCDNGAGLACPAIACVAATGATCAATDAGGGTCSTVYATPN